MNGSNQSFNQQIESVLTEYERAVQDGAERKALNIRDANPDLTKDFDRIDSLQVPTV